LFVITAGYNVEQIAPAMGLLGTIAGYLVGQRSADRPLRDDSNNHVPPGGDPQAPQATGVVSSGGNRRPIMKPHQATVATALLFSALSTFAVRGEVKSYGPVGNENLPTSRVLVLNRGVQGIQFNLSDNQQEWYPFALPPAQNDTYGLQNGIAGKLFIRIRTGDRDAVSTLMPGNRYVIFWNKVKRIWDVEPARRR
jgi:hypothetical protein